MNNVFRKEIKKMQIKKSLFTLASSTLLLAGCMRGPNSGRMGGWDPMMGYWYYGGVMWLIFLIALGVGVYFILRTVKLKGPDNSPAETPLDILKKRYAKGEINKEEYEQKKKDLES
jgi:putative membrane protein